MNGMCGIRAGSCPQRLATIKFFRRRMIVVDHPKRESGTTTSSALSGRRSHSRPATQGIGLMASALGWALAARWAAGQATVANPLDHANRARAHAVAQGPPNPTHRPRPLDPSKPTVSVRPTEIVRLNGPTGAPRHNGPTGASPHANAARPNGPTEPSPGLRPQAEALGKRTSTHLRPERAPDCEGLG